MSPYTWWIFKLSEAKQGNVSLLDLEEFLDEMDLELHGTGVYLYKSRLSREDLDGLKLAEFYEVFDGTMKWEKDTDNGLCPIVFSW